MHLMNAVQTIVIQAMLGKVPKQECWKMECKDIYHMAFLHVRTLNLVTVTWGPMIRVTFWLRCFEACGRHGLIAFCPC